MKGRAGGTAWVKTIAALALLSAAAVVAIAIWPPRPSRPAREADPLDLSVEPVPMDDPSLGRAVNGLRAHLVAAKDEFSLGEDVRLTLTITNASDDNITLFEHEDSLYHYAFHTRFVVELPGGEAVVLWTGPFAMTEASFPARRTLRPGEAYAWETVLNTWRPTRTPGAMVLSPGNYRLYADYSIPERMSALKMWTGRLRSAAAAFTVKAEPFLPDPPAISWGEPVQGVRCGVALDKAVYARGDNVTGTVYVENVSANAEAPVEVLDWATAYDANSGAYERVALADSADVSGFDGGLWIAPGKRVERRFTLPEIARRAGAARPAALRVTLSGATTRHPADRRVWIDTVSSGEVRALLVDVLPGP